MEFIHSVLAQDVAVTAGTVVTYDLPVNPLSHILLTLRWARTLGVQMCKPRISDCLDFIDKIEVLYKGSAIFSMSGIDAVACGIFIPKFETWGVNFAGIDDEECSFTTIIPLTRFLYSESECFPRSTRGELVLQITYNATFVDATSMEEQIETVELPDASPTQFLRMTTLTQTLVAGGENDVDLPIGNPISDLVVWGTTIPAGAANLATLGYLQLLTDNQRRYYSHINFETIHNMAGRMRAAPGYWGYHTHFFSAAAAISGPVLASNHILENHVHLPFDTTGDGKYILETAGKSDVTLRIGVDAGAQGPVRVIPCEIVPAGGGV